MDRADIVHNAFVNRVTDGKFPIGARPTGPLSAIEAVAIFRSQCLSRNLDRRSRKMQKVGQGFYTIGSSGTKAWPRLRPRFGSMTWRSCITATGRSRPAGRRWCREPLRLGICC